MFVQIWLGRNERKTEQEIVPANIRGFFEMEAFIKMLT